MESSPPSTMHQFQFVGTFLDELARPFADSSGPPEASQLAARMAARNRLRTGNLSTFNRFGKTIKPQTEHSKQAEKEMEMLDIVNCKIVSAELKNRPLIGTLEFPMWEGS